GPRWPSRTGSGHSWCPGPATSCSGSARTSSTAPWSCSCETSWPADYACGVMEAGFPQPDWPEHVAQLVARAEEAAEQLRLEAERRADERIAEADRAAEYRVAAAEEDAQEILAAARAEQERAGAEAAARVRDLENAARQEAARIRNEADEYAAL